MLSVILALLHMLNDRRCVESRGRKVFLCHIILIKVRISAVHMAMSYLEYNPNRVDIEILLCV